MSREKQKPLDIDFGDKSAAHIPPAKAGQPVRLLPSGAHRDMIQLEIATARAQQAWVAKCAGLPEDTRPAFVPPYTSGQIEIARAYRDLVEWRAGSGLRGSALAGGGGGGEGSFIDTFLQQGRMLERLQRSIGDAVVMDVRRNMDRDNARRAITAVALVNAVCLLDLDLSAVLTRHGWSAKGQHRDQLRRGLCEALDRMQGLRPAVVAAHADPDAQGFRLPANTGLTG